MMRDVINQLRPFNKERFDECMAFLCAEHRSTLTQYDMVKLHIMADVFHFLQYGKPIIGGPMFRWKNGPVVRPAYNRVRRWGRQWEETGTQPDAFRIVGKRRTAFLFKPARSIDSGAFSQNELSSLDRAWRCVMTKGWKESQEFFHGANSFIGRAWNAASDDGQPIDWQAIIDAYQSLHPDFQNTDHLKALVEV